MAGGTLTPQALGKAAVFAVGKAVWVGPGLVCGLVCGLVGVSGFGKIDVVFGEVTGGFHFFGGVVCTWLVVCLPGFWVKPS